MYKKYPVNKPLISEYDVRFVSQTLEDGWISSEGPSVSQFEIEFSKTVDRKFGIAVSSGTAGLDVCVEISELCKGDEVIVPAFTIISTINAILRKGAYIKFVDCLENNYSSSEEDIISQITSKTKLIICAHIYCYPVNYAKLENICKNQNIILVEDAAELFGVKINNRTVGSFGDMSIVSFYPNKFITTGEGGMILTNSKKTYEASKKIRNLGFDPNNRFVHNVIGYNYRMTSMQASLGLSQLKNLYDNIVKKQHIGQWYFDHLARFNELEIPPPSLDGIDNYYWVVPLHIPKASNVLEFSNKLAELGVGTRPQFFPLNLQPVLNNYNIEIIDNCQNAKNNYYTGIYLPNSLELSEADVEEICSRIIKVALDVCIIS